MFLTQKKLNKCHYSIGEHIFLVYFYYVKDNKINTLNHLSCLDAVLKKAVDCKNIFFDIRHFVIKKEVGATGLVAQGLDENENPINVAAYNHASTDNKGFFENYVWEVTELYGEELGKRRFYTDLRYVINFIEDHYDILGELGAIIAEKFPQSHKFNAIQS